MVCALAGSLWLAGRGGAVVATTPHPVWTEVAWPFPIDEWGKGKAFHSNGQRVYPRREE